VSVSIFTGGSAVNVGDDFRGFPRFLSIYAAFWLQPAIFSLTSSNLEHSSALFITLPRSTRVHMRAGAPVSPHAK